MEVLKVVPGSIILPIIGKKNEDICSRATIILHYRIKIAFLCF